MLDTNVSTEVALAFKLGIGKRLQALGARIEQLYPGLKAGEGAALLTNCYALIIGLWQQADPPLSLRPVMERPEMRIFKIDFEKQLNAALLDLWEAALRRRGEMRNAVGSWSRFSWSPARRRPKTRSKKCARCAW